MASDFLYQSGPPSRLSFKIENIRPALERVVNTTFFSVGSSLVICTYAIFIAIETHMISENPNINSFEVKVCHYVYNVIFLLELMLRIVASGCWSALCGQDAVWNRLDALLAISAITETVTELLFTEIDTDRASSVVRAVRLARVLRTVRLVRTLRSFHEFQKMAYALVSSMKTLACSLTLLLFVMFFFAVGFTLSAADLDRREEIPDLDLRYRTLFHSAYTLFLSVSNGISWDYAYMPLHRLGPRSAAAFIFYIVITMFGVLNVVTSIFVESVVRSAQHYKDLLVQDKEVSKQIAVSHVKEVFRQLDYDGSGRVTQEELEHFLKDSSLRRYMEALDIDAADARLLFRLLTDGAQDVSLEEFCDGCLRLKGHAKSIDVHTLIFQMTNFLNRWGEFTFFVEDSFAKIRKVLPRDLAGDRKNQASSKPQKYLNLPTTPQPN